MGNVLSEYDKTPSEVELGSSGKIKGVQLDTKARRYLGVPYALPPTGDLRWRKPSPLPASHSYSSSDGTPFDATEFGPVCFQPNYSGSVKRPEIDYTYSEDCLRLNIWTPISDGSNKKYPVMVWLHGGWFQVGDPSHDISMDPTELVSTRNLNSIVVAVGYRLNLFGFLAGDALTEESGSGVCGNYGLWDQRLAMEWVHKNISFFGGDPENITLAGRSAGSFAVQAQAVYDFRAASSQLFRRLVMFSNAIPAQPKTLLECQDQFDELSTYFGISKPLSAFEKLKSLRKISGEDLTAVIMKLEHHTFRPVTDDEFIQPGLIEYIRDGFFAEEFKKKGTKLLIGEVLNEETLYAVTNPPKEPTIEALETQISNYYAPSTTSRVLRYYDLPTSTNIKHWENVFGRIISDGQVRAPLRFLVDSLLAHGVHIRDIWRYRIEYRLSFITEKVAPVSFGVSHAMDKPFWK